MNNKYDELMFNIQTEYSVENELLNNDMMSSIFMFDDEIDEVEEAYGNNAIDFWEHESLLSHIEDYKDRINEREEYIKNLTINK